MKIHTVKPQLDARRAGPMRMQFYIFDMGLNSNHATHSAAYCLVWFVLPEILQLRNQITDCFKVFYKNFLERY